VLYNCMSIEDLKLQVLEAFATAQGVRRAAGDRVNAGRGYRDGNALEVDDSRKDMQDAGEPVRVEPSKDGSTKVTRKIRKPKKGGPLFRTRVVSSTELVRGARLALAERILGEMYGGMVSSIKDPRKRDDAEFEAGRMNKKAQRALNKKRISKKATAQAQKIIQGDDPDQPTLSGGSRPWNKPLT